MAKSKNVLGFWEALGRFFKILPVAGKKTPSFREAFRAYQRDPKRRKEFRMKGRSSVIAVENEFQKKRAICKKRKRIQKRCGQSLSRNVNPIIIREAHEGMKYYNALSQDERRRLIFEDEEIVRQMQIIAGREMNISTCFIHHSRG